MAEVALSSSLLCQSSSSAVMSQLQRDAWREPLGNINPTEHYPQSKHDGCMRGAGPVDATLRGKFKTERALLRGDGVVKRSLGEQLAVMRTSLVGHSSAVHQVHHLLAKFLIGARKNSPL